MIGDLGRWLVSDSVNLSPIGVVGMCWIYRWVANTIERRLVRRGTEIIDLPGGGRIEVRGYSVGLLADLVQRTGGTLRPRGGVR